MVDGDTATDVSRDSAAPTPQLREKEKVEQDYWQGGSNKLTGRFEDMIQVKPDRTIYQYFTINNKEVPISLGRDNSGHIMETPKVKVTLGPQVKGGIQYEPYSGP
jgi:hypothetical protein